MKCIDTVPGLSGTCTRRAADPFQFPPEKIPGLIGTGHHIGNPLFPFFQKCLVISFIHIEVAPVQLIYGIANPIEKIAVVRDHKKSRSRFFQIIFQKLNDFHIQMVGGFVQDKKIGVLQQQPRNSRSFYLTSR